MTIIQENTAPRDYGCLMAYPCLRDMNKFATFNKKLLPSHMLYEKPGDNGYGVEQEPHCTLKYGFTPDLKLQDLASILKGIKPFDINVIGLSKFENPEFDVVKFDIKPTQQLTKLRNICDEYPNEDKYPDYKPHMTVGYVKKNTFSQIRENLNLKLRIERIVYSSSSRNNNKRYIINLR